jgi:hypothetical protein
LNRIFSPHSPLPLCLFKIDYNIILPFRPTSLTRFFFLFSYKALCTFLSHLRYVFRYATSRRSDNPDNILLAVQIVKLLTTLFCRASSYFVLPFLDPFVLSTPFSSSLCMRHYVSHPYKTIARLLFYVFCLIFFFFFDSRRKYKIFRTDSKQELPELKLLTISQLYNFDI